MGTSPFFPGSYFCFKTSEALGNSMTLLGVRALALLANGSFQPQATFYWPDPAYTELAVEAF